MPKSNKWFMMRLTDRNRDREQIILDIMKDVLTFVVAEEPHDNKDNYHYHSFHTCRHTTIHSRLHRHNIKGNENFAFTYLQDNTQEHMDRCLSYLCKGQKLGSMPCVILNSLDLTEQQIEEYHNDWWNKWQHDREPEKQLKKNKLQLIYDFIPPDAFIEGTREVMRQILRYYRTHDFVEPNDFQLRCYLKTIIFKHIQEKHSNRVNQFLDYRSKEIIGGEFKYDYFMNVKRITVTQDSQNLDNEQDDKLFSLDK